MTNIAVICVDFQALASMVSDADLEQGRIYPPLKLIREVSTLLATSVVEYAYANGLASAYPEPDDKEAYVRQHQYDTSYENFVPKTYPWPGMVEVD
jgi:malate dehydrogenase (oxaloacetate-decarboxylating)(NADP+)